MQVSARKPAIDGTHAPLLRLEKRLPVGPPSRGVRQAQRSWRRASRGSAACGAPTRAATPPPDARHLQGNKLRKYGRRGKPKDHHFKLSQDLTELVWDSSNVRAPGRGGGTRERDAACRGGAGRAEAAACGRRVC